MIDLEASPTLGQTLQDAADMLEGCMALVDGVSRVPVDLKVLIQQAAQHAQTLRGYFGHYGSDELRAVADWLAGKAPTP